MRTTDPARVQRIIDSATRLFARRHYHEVRMDDIAAEAVVAKGTLYLHFKTKEELYAALLVTGGQRLLKQLEEKLSAPDTPERKLEKFVQHVVAFFESYPYFFELVQRVEGMVPEGQDSPLQANRTRFYHMLTALLKEFRCSRYKVEDPGLAALCLMGMIKEILRFQPKPWPDSLAQWIVGQFLHGVG